LMKQLNEGICLAELLRGECRFWTHAAFGPMRFWSNSPAQHGTITTEI